MKMLRALKAAGLIITAVVLGLMTVQGSYALWNAAAPSNAGTVQAANFSILVDAVEMNSRPIVFNTGELAQGKAAYKSVDVTNNVNVSPASRLLVQPALTGLGPVAGFDGNLTVKAVAAAAGAECAAISPASYSAAPVIPVVPVGATQRICLQVQLSATTPAAYLGKQITSTVALTVAQVQPVLK